MFESLNTALEPLNSSKLFAGITMLILNVGAKYITVDFTKTQEAALKKALSREILIFVIIFTATRDIIISILMTAAFVILADHLFNNESKHCVIPKKFWDVYAAADSNKDGEVSLEERQAAISILEKTGDIKISVEKSKPNYVISNKPGSRDKESSYAIDDKESSYAIDDKESYYAIDDQESSYAIDDQESSYAILPDAAPFGIEYKPTN